VWDRRLKLNHLNRISRPTFRQSKPSSSCAILDSQPIPRINRMVISSRNYETRRCQSIVIHVAPFQAGSHTPPKFLAYPLSSPFHSSARPFPRSQLEGLRKRCELHSGDHGNPSRLRIYSVLIGTNASDKNTPDGYPAQNRKLDIVRL
jgi:hypothetical protein